VEKIPSLETLIAVAATVAFGQKLGPLVSTFALIVFGWFGGMLVGLLRLQTDSEDGVRTRVRTLWFVAVSFVVTVGSASTAATWLAAHNGGSPADWLFFVALGIPAVGMDWIRIGKWFAALVGRGVERLVESRIKG
jgi:hypothetical protein